MLFKSSDERLQKSKLTMLAKKYEHSAFMYTHYPHKRFWSQNKNDASFKSSLITLNKQNNLTAMLYVHMPYCQQLCYFCTCHVSITNDYQKVKDYMEILFKEIDHFSNFLADNKIKLDVKEIHLGGGSPTFIEEAEFDILCQKLEKIVDIKLLREFAIEIDPRRVDVQKMRYYHSKGINRISFGIQDFDPKVQNAVNRIQPVELIEDLLTTEIRDLFKNGINFDIICGLPHQTVDSIKLTAKECVRLSPERICLNYLHYSPVFAPQQKFMIDGKDGRPTKLPDFFERKELFSAVQDVLVDGGYVRTGYDHFAKPFDDVAKAVDQKKVYWNSMGVTPGEYNNIIGLGISSESTVGNSYFQNFYDMLDYTSSVLSNCFPVYREYELTDDDLVRKDVIQQIRNYFEINFSSIEEAHKINFQSYFSDEMTKIKTFEEDEILVIEKNQIRLTETGRQFTNIVCRVFDKYYSDDLRKKDLGIRAD